MELVFKGEKAPREKHWSAACVQTPLCTTACALNQPEAGRGWSISSLPKSLDKTEQNSNMVPAAAASPVHLCVCPPMVFASWEKVCNVMSKLFVAASQQLPAWRGMNHSAQAGSAKGVLAWWQLCQIKPISWNNVSFSKGSLCQHCTAATADVQTVMCCLSPCLLIPYLQEAPWMRTVLLIFLFKQ